MRRNSIPAAALHRRADKQLIQTALESRPHIRRRHPAGSHHRARPIRNGLLIALKAVAPMPLQLVQSPPPPQPPPPQPPPPQLPPPPQPPPPLQPPPGPVPTLPPARHASRRRSRGARTIRIISQITPGTITMTTTIIKMLVTAHPLANRCRRCRRYYLEVSAHLRRWVRVVGYSFSSAIVLVGYLSLAVHHRSSRGSRW
jgi:hypothetical protein